MSCKCCSPSLIPKQIWKITNTENPWRKYEQNLTFDSGWERGLVHEWAEWFPCMQIETRHTDTPFPPLMCRKMWMRKWEPKMKRHPPIHYSNMYPSPPPPSRLEPGAHVIPWLDRPHNVYMPFVLTHTHTRITRAHTSSYTLPALPSVTYIACSDTYTIIHATRSRGGEYPHPPLLQNSQWAASVSGEELSMLALKNTGRHTEGRNEHCFCIADAYWTVILKFIWALWNIYLFYFFVCLV